MPLKSSLEFPTIVREKFEVRVHPPGVMHPIRPGFDVGVAMWLFCEMSQHSAEKRGSIGGSCAALIIVYTSTMSRCRWSKSETREGQML